MHASEDCYFFAGLVGHADSRNKLGQLSFPANVQQPIESAEFDVLQPESGGDYPISKKESVLNKTLIGLIPPLIVFH